jgi:ribonucleoside-diphosphate reductase alpha chain
VKALGIAWHPDIIEFIISKMQNPRVLRFIIDKTKDPKIKKLAKDKLKFTPLTPTERAMYEGILQQSKQDSGEIFSSDVVREAEQKLADGGTYSVNNPDFLTGANISICLTNEFMTAVENNAEYQLRFPDVENYTEQEMKAYNAEWYKSGDVREWEAKGYGVRVYQTLQAKELWNLVNICATYSAEPGIFFIDNANEMTNAKAYGQKVVATNPCGRVA